MFMVGGGIIMHGLPWLANVGHSAGEWGAGLPAVGPVMHVLLPLLCDAVAGIVTGALVLAGVSLVTGLHARVRQTS